MSVPLAFTAAFNEQCSCARSGHFPKGSCQEPRGSIGHYSAATRRKPSAMGAGGSHFTVQAKVDPMQRTQPAKRQGQALRPDASAESPGECPTDPHALHPAGAGGRFGHEQRPDRVARAACPFGHHSVRHATQGGKFSGPAPGMAGGRSADLAGSARIGAVQSPPPEHEQCGLCHSILSLKLSTLRRHP